MFMVFAAIDPPFCNQMVLEGTGVLDEPLWKKAVEAACEANPGSRLVYRGLWKWAKWVDTGVAAPIRVIDGSGWSGYDSDTAPFLFDPFPHKTSHTCEVQLINGNKPRVAFRSHHAAMDGVGTLLWALDVFRALRNEPLVGTPSTTTDKELLESIGFPKKAYPKPVNCLSPIGFADGNASGFCWKRTTLEGKFSKLLPQLALAIAREARKQGQGNVLIAVPVDLRRRVPGTASTANLTRRVLLNVPVNATIDSLQEEMQKLLNNLGGDPVFSSLVSYTPLPWMKRLFIKSRYKNREKGFFQDSGTISNLGRLPIESLKGGGFEAETSFFIPPEMEFKPFFITLTGAGNKVEMITALPNVLATNGRLDNFIANTTAELKPS